MRPDFAKLLVERERVGVNGSQFIKRAERRKLNHPRDWDDVPRRGKIEPGFDSGTRRYSNKQLNENLSPLKRFVESAVGRHWDDVYSEIREHISSDNTVQAHIFQHLWQYVERYAVLNADGVPCERRMRKNHHYDPKTHKTTYGPLIKDLDPLSSGSIYIHPETGILCKVPKSASKASKTEPLVRGFKDLQREGTEGCIVLSPTEVYVKQNGLWYEVEMRRVPLPWGYPEKKTRLVTRQPFGTLGPKVTAEETYDDEGPGDFLLGVHIGQTGYHPSDKDGHIVRMKAKDLYGALTHYAHRRGGQLNTKKLRALGVKNDPPEEIVPLTSRQKSSLSMKRRGYRI